MARRTVMGPARGRNLGPGTYYAPRNAMGPDRGVVAPGRYQTGKPAPGGFGGAPAPKPWTPPSGYVFPGGAPGTPAAPPAPPAPAAPAAAPEATNAWQDSAYNSSIANLLAGRDSGAAALDALGRRAVEDRDATRGLLDEGRTKTRTATTQSANKNGLFSSGILGKSLGDVDTSYARQQADLNAGFARGEQDRAAQRAALTDTFNRGNTEAAGSAWDRYVAAAAATESASSPGLEELIGGLNSQFINMPAKAPVAAKPAAKKPAVKKPAPAKKKGR